MADTTPTHISNQVLVPHKFDSLEVPFRHSCSTSSQFVVMISLFCGTVASHLTCLVVRVGCIHRTLVLSFGWCCFCCPFLHSHSSVRSGRRCWCLRLPFFLCPWPWLPRRRPSLAPPAVWVQGLHVRLRHVRHPVLMFCCAQRVRQPALPSWPEVQWRWR